MTRLVDGYIYDTDTAALVHRDRRFSFYETLNGAYFYTDEADIYPTTAKVVAAHLVKAGKIKKAKEVLPTIKEA